MSFDLMYVRALQMRVKQYGPEPTPALLYRMAAHSYHGVP